MHDDVIRELYAAPCDRLGLSLSGVIADHAVKP